MNVEVAKVAGRQSRRPRGCIRVGATQSLLVGSLVACAIPAFSQAPTVPAGFSRTLVAGVPAGGGANPIVGPTAMQFAPDGRLFVCEQAGAVRVVKNGALLTTPFMTLNVNSQGERGLLGIAFDPGFATNNFIYFYYTVPSAPIHSRVSRFTANGDVVVAGSEFVVTELDNLGSATNHNGGTIRFGTDGMLYVAVGDSGTSANAQSMATRHGKILRLNPNGTIPNDNPFFATATGDNRAIWALGLRNPFTMQFEPATSRLFINDVGESTWEEINQGAAGANYGWPTTEGEFNPGSFPAFTNPLLAYDHSGGACAITGGAFYPTSATNFPVAYRGRYFYADFCAGFIRTYDRLSDTSAAFATGLSSAVDLKVGPNGALYVLQRGSAADAGNVYRIDHGAAVAPTLTLSTNTASPGQPIQVTVANGPGNRTDWVGVHAVSAADTAWSDWKYLSGTRTAPVTGLTSAVLTFAAPNTAGTYNFRFFQSGAYTLLATSATLTVSGTSLQPTLTLSTANASPGQTVQVTLANGPGNAKDWIGLHTVAASDMAWFDWKYLNGTRTAPASGAASAVVSFAAPSVAGTYNFRLFQNNTFTRLATSATLTVSGTSTPTLTLSTSTASPGQVVQVTLANGPGNAKDWIGLHAVAAADTAWSDWKYLNGTRTAPLSGQTSAVVSFSAPAAGTYNFRLFQNNTFSKLATSATLTVTGTATPSLSVSTATASPGQVVQVTLGAGPGNPRDWIGLYLSSATDAAWLDWKYLNATRTPPMTGTTSGTVPFTLPMTAGTYEFRFFQNNTFTKLATSPTVTVP